MLEKTEGRRRRGRQRMSLLNGITDSMYMNLSKLQAIVKEGKSGVLVDHGVAKSRTQLSNSIR